MTEEKVEIIQQRYKALTPEEEKEFGRKGPFSNSVLMLYAFGRCYKYHKGLEDDQWKSLTIIEGAAIIKYPLHIACLS